MSYRNLSTLLLHYECRSCDLKHLKHLPFSDPIKICPLFISLGRLITMAAVYQSSAWPPGDIMFKNCRRVIVDLTMIPCCIYLALQFLQVKYSLIK